MSNGSRLPIWRDCNRLLLEIEQAVRGFPRYHKYAVGADMRRQAMYICRLLVRTLDAEGDKRLAQVRQLRLAVDDLKIMIQLAKEIKAFKSPLVPMRRMGTKNGLRRRHTKGAAS